MVMNPKVWHDFKKAISINSYIKECKYYIKIVLVAPLKCTDAATVTIE